MLGTEPDVALARYVDVGELGDAWHTLDADRLVDIALELRAAENKFQRGHHTGLDHKSILHMALAIAQQRHLEETIARLDRISAHLDLESLLADLAAGRTPDDNKPESSLNPLTVSEQKLLDRVQHGLLKARLKKDSECVEYLLAEIPKKLSSRILFSGTPKSRISDDVAHAARVMDELSNEQAETLRRNDRDERESQTGRFNVSASARNGVLYRNYSNSQREIGFSGSGRWTYHPRQGYHGPGGHPRHDAGGNFMLPGRPAGGLIALPADGGGFRWVGDDRLDLVLGPYATVKFFCNDAYNGFGDNRGSVTVRWGIIVRPPFFV